VRESTPCVNQVPASAEEEAKPEAKADLSSLSSMLQARWKGSTPAREHPNQKLSTAGQIRSFRIAMLDREAKKIELELA